METLGRHRSWLLALLGALVVVVGVVVWLGGQDGTAEEPRRAVEEPSAAPRTSDSEVVAGNRIPQAERVPRQPGDPLRIRIPDLDVDAPVVPIAAPGGVLTPPADPQVLGWWADGARPGEQQGSALLTGHTVSTGGGALDDLEELTEGDAIRVRSARTETPYAVDTVQILDKGDLAVRAEKLFDQQVAGRLVVVTCEDWDGEEYLSNVVVTASPARAR
ncbi:class F sortase [Nocardioides sp. GXQ0305]|uniref:class F sortase n=1 Tax=Nocardioides sp. GXQ0305 TaxID=3423912 RepID=UPI003D7EB42F